MSVLDQQSIRREIGNRRLGRRRLEARLRGEESAERRRPGRGALREPKLVRRRSLGSDRESTVANLLVGLGRSLALIGLLPLQFLFLALRPRELVARIKALPSRIESGIRRLRMASRDPETRAGRLWDTAILSMHFLREEMADMQDGFPSRDEVLRDINSGAGLLRGKVESLVGRAHDAAPARPPGRLFDAVSLGLVVGTVVVGLFIAGHGALEAVTESDRMLVQDIHVTGASRTAAHAVLAELGARPGDRLLRLDLEAAAAGVALLPWVAEVSVTTRLRERTLDVRVVEHRPALILARGGLHLVDDAGTPFKRLHAGDPGDLPVLTGLEGLGSVDTEEGREVLRGALDVLHSLSASGVVGLPTISEIRWEGEDGWAVVTRDGLPVRLGRQDFGARLGRLERAVARAGLPLSAIASIDVGLRDRLVVVPKRTKRAKRRVVQVVREQPVPKTDRAQHIDRIRRAMSGQEG